ncbi:hypothetical protein NA57DRAFT_60447 [Rhizodiscina lignyota]|uniref:Homeobox domain-containing protein n=1 Tax=Rhizodiscina lignyota TaxID=1504668 RepID=A0A9P4I7N3_9PEZI|nr:hypothetical protein NA57DRAFT_60447 [Rhizodiscina lignyota]
MASRTVSNLELEGSLSQKVHPFEPAGCSQLDLEKSAEFADSGYSSVTSSAKRDTLLKRRSTTIEGEQVGKRRFSRPKPVNLKQFDIHIPDAIRNRFNDLQELFKDDFHRHLLVVKGQHGPLSVKLKMLGENYETATPYVVVFCSKHLCKRVRQFFNQSVVREEYSSADHADRPSFKILVSELPPNLLAGELVITLSCDCELAHQPSNIGYMSQICLPIRVLDSGAPQEMAGPPRGTLSSPVKVTWSDDNFRLFAFTANHICQWTQTSSTTSTDDDDESGIDSGMEIDDFHKEALSDDGSITSVELDQEALPNVKLALLETDPEESVEQQRCCMHKHEEIGSLFASSAEADSLNERADFDWALVDSPKYLARLLKVGRNRWTVGDRHIKAMTHSLTHRTGLTKNQREFLEGWHRIQPEPSDGQRMDIARITGLPLDTISNWFNSHGAPHKQAFELTEMGSTNVDEEYVVYVLTASRGALPGQLVCHNSSFATSFNKPSIKTHGLRLRETHQALLPGDSGSWIVDATDGRVYGHLIAVDAFGDGYVVPLEDSLQDMANQLGAVSASLVTSEDLSDAASRDYRLTILANIGVDREPEDQLQPEHEPERFDPKEMKRRRTLFHDVKLSTLFAALLGDGVYREENVHCEEDNSVSLPTQLTPESGLILKVGGAYIQSPPMQFSWSAPGKYEEAA